MAETEEAAEGEAEAEEEAAEAAGEAEAEAEAEGEEAAASAKERRSSLPRRSAAWSVTGLRYRGDMGRYMEIWGDTRRYGEIQGDMGRYREIWGDVAPGP